MVDAKQQMTQGLSWFRPRGPYVQQWCARGTILLGTGVLVVGQVQARWEKKRGFQVPGEWLEMLWESKRVSAQCVVFLRIRPPAAGGSLPLL
jgi:hypothetical protein